MAEEQPKPRAEDAPKRSAEEQQKLRELHLQERRVILDEKRLLLESRFMRRNFAVVVTLLVAVAICVVTAGITYTSFLSFQREVTQKKLEFEQALVLSRLEAQREAARHVNLMEQKLADLVMASPEARSLDPAGVAQILAMANHLFPLPVRQQAIDAFRAAGAKAGDDAGAKLLEAANEADRESLQIESERKRTGVFILPQAPEDVGTAKKIAEEMSKLGYRTWVADPSISPKLTAKVDVRYSYEDQPRAMKLAGDLRPVLEAIKPGMGAQLEVVRSSESDLLGDRSGFFEIWLPSPPQAEPEPAP